MKVIKTVRYPTVDISSTMLGMIVFLSIIAAAQVIMTANMVAPNPIERPLSEVLPPEQQKWIPVYNFSTLLTKFVFGLSLPILIVLSYFLGPLLIVRGRRWVTDPKQIATAENLVSEVANSLRISKAPNVRIEKTKATNAILIGIWPARPTLIITSALLQSCTKNQVIGVLSHELSHILNRDMSFMTWAFAFINGAKYWVLAFIVIESFSAIEGIALGYLSTDQPQFPTLESLGPIWLIILALAGLAGLFYGSVSLVTRMVSRRRELLADARASLTVGVASLKSAIGMVASHRLGLANSSGTSQLTFLSNHPSIKDRLIALEHGTYIIVSRRFYLPSLKAAISSGLVALVLYVLPVLSLAYYAPAVFDLLYGSLLFVGAIIAMASNYLFVRYSDWEYLKTLKVAKKVRMVLTLIGRNMLSASVMYLPFFAAAFLLALPLLIVYFFMVGISVIGYGSLAMMIRALL